MYASNMKVLHYPYGKHARTTNALKTQKLFEHVTKGSLSQPMMTFWNGGFEIPIIGVHTT